MKVIRDFHVCLLIFSFLPEFSFPNSVFSLFLSSLALLYIRQNEIILAGSLLVSNRLLYLADVIYL